MSRFTDLLKFGDIGGIVTATSTFGVIPLSAQISTYVWLMAGSAGPPPVPSNKGRFRLAAVTMAALGMSIRNARIASPTAPVTGSGVGKIIRNARGSLTLPPVQQEGLANIVGDTLWTPASLLVAPYVEVDPSTATWSGSDLTALTNPGSIGGNYALLNTPTKAASDANGKDAIAFNASALYVAGASAIPTGDLIFFYVAKASGTPPTGFGMIAAQFDAQPGWFLVDQITASGVLSNGHAYSAGDRVFNGWPAGSSSTNHDVIVTPPVTSGYRVTSVKVGTAAFWRQDGADITPKYLGLGSHASSSSALSIGSSSPSGPHHWLGKLAYFLILPGSTSTDELQKLEGWAAWEFGTVDYLDASHPWKLAPPTI